MRNAAAHLRVAASVGLAVAILITVVPAAFAAPATPSDSYPSDSYPSDQIATALASPLDAVTFPVELGPREGRSTLPDLLAVPALLTTGSAELASVPPTTTSSAAARVVALAKSHLGARYVWGAQGPRGFDCSGLVLRTYAQAGLIGKLGGWGNRSGYAIYSYGRRHHLVSTTHGQPGDVVVWGGGGHVGIYLGHGMAISALRSGVRIHGIHAVTKRFTAFVHTGLTGVQVRNLTASATTRTRSIGIRHAGPSLRLLTAHDTAARTISTLRAGTRLTLVRIWHDAHGRTWYRVNANGHVGWVAGWLTRT